MTENKLEFIINKDSTKNKVELDGMSVEAASAFSVLLNSMVKIVQANPNNEGLRIQIKSGSAVLIAEGTEEQIEEIQENFTDILNFKSSNKELVGEWRAIQSLFLANGLEYEANIYKKNQKTSILPHLKSSKIFRSKPVSTPLKSSIKFLQGKLIAVGGSNPNIHLEDSTGKRITISCTEVNAKKANRFLYDKILISCWVKAGGQDERYELCDSYWKVEDFRSLESFIKEFAVTSDEINQLKMLHYKCRDFLDNKDYGSVRKFIRLFNHDSTDVNILKTILIITQPFKDHERLKDMRQGLKELFEKKMADYKRKKSKN
ncbi:MAG: hypothetical protein EOP45_01045 [Sphingobacteriaceae bacterium]|nr:MAG: hypothetical protein EOP45_01045 [Sphingobacteriaceae bacterium]